MATKKDAYYFSHDANAQDDPKCMLLIDQLGMEGYGIFWALIEKLRSEKDYKLPFAVIPSLARRWGTSKEKVETVVKTYNLFITEEQDFFSARLVRSMGEKSEKARISANKRWQSLENQQDDANAMQPQCDRIETHMPNDAIKVKESKVNTERKENESNETASEDFFPDKSLHGVDLQTDEADNTIVYVETITNKKINKQEVERMWKAFKIQYFTGKNGYKDWTDVIQHFRDWLKKQVINNKNVQTDFVTDKVAVVETHKTEFQKAVERQKQLNQD